jgi:hypothetical protein
MRIYDKTGEVLLDIPVDDDSYRYRAIAQAKKVELRYSLVDHVELPTGTYIEYHGERYTLWYLRISRRRARGYSTIPSPSAATRRS